MDSRRIEYCDYWPVPWFEWNSCSPVGVFEVPYTPGESPFSLTVTLYVTAMANGGLGGNYNEVARPARP